MRPDLKSSMFEYYSQRAPGFDDVYLGAGPTSASDPEAYREEVKILREIVTRNCSGELIDIACGTAFWLPQYAANCSRIILFDQSQEMLERAQERAVAQGVAEQTTVRLGDALEDEFGRARFDTALVAFLISHFSADEEIRFFQRLIPGLKQKGKILILDSAWNETRALTREKQGWQRRTLQGREFDVYKKYFEKADLQAMNASHNIELKVEYFGKVFFAATASSPVG